MKKIVATLCVMFLLGLKTYATDLRGYVQGYNGYTQQYFPISGVYVEFWYWNTNLARWVIGSSTYTGYDGLYYFYNVIPMFTYYIKVYGKFYPVTVNKKDYQDISPITIL